MKSIVITLVMLLFSVAMYAQEQDKIRTIFSNTDDFGFYYGFSGKGSMSPSGLYSGDVGMHAVMVYNHAFGLGINGSGLFYQNQFDTLLNGSFALQGGYAGFYIEPILFGTFPVHLAFPFSAGAGSMQYRKVEEDSYTDYVEAQSMFFYAEPSVQLQMNIFRHFRMAFGASYRFVSHLDLNYSGTNNPIYSSNDMSGLTLGVSLKFGSF